MKIVIATLAFMIVTPVLGFILGLLMINLFPEVGDDQFNNVVFSWRMIPVVILGLAGGIQSFLVTLKKH